MFIKYWLTEVMTWVKNARQRAVQNDLNNSCSLRCLTYYWLNFFPPCPALFIYVCQKDKSLCTVDVLDAFFPAEFSLTVCSWRTQCLSGPQGWSKSFFLYNMLICWWLWGIISSGVDFIVGIYSWAGNDVQSSAWEDEIICLSESIEPRRWKERLAKVFS